MLPDDEGDTMTATYLGSGRPDGSHPTDPRNTFRDFLMSRRARMSPGTVGLPEEAGRRVAGLRREEVAMLARISPEYYVQIERGRLAGVSDKALLAIIQALRLDEVERDHFLNLAATLRGERVGRRLDSVAATVPTGLQAVMDAMQTVAAVVQNSVLDIVASNALGRALFAPVLDSPDGIGNFARFVFLDKRSREYFPDRQTVAANVVTILRVEAGRSPDDHALTALINLLNARSKDFAERWARHEVAAHLRGPKAVQHPLVGRLQLHFESLDVPGRDGMTLVAYAPRDADTRTRLVALASTSTGNRQGADRALLPVIQRTGR